MALEDLQHPKHYVAGGVYVKELLLEKAGDMVVTHKHAYDHLSLLAYGCVMVTVEGISTCYNGRTAVLVKAGLEHEIRSLEPSLWYCIHEVPEGLRGEELLDGAVIQQEVKPAHITSL